MHPSGRAVCLNQTNDGQQLRERNNRPGTLCLFKTRLWHFIDGLCLCILQRQSLLDLSLLRKGGIAHLYSSVPAGCPASGFRFVMAFDPIYRWLYNSAIPSDPALPISYNLCHSLLPMISPLQLFPFAPLCCTEDSGQSLA